MPIWANTIDVISSARALLPRRVEFVCSMQRCFIPTAYCEQPNEDSFQKKMFV